MSVAARQTALLTRRMMLNELRNPASAIPNLVMTIFFLFVYDGSMGGSAAVARLTGGDYVNFLLPVTVLLASLGGGAAGFALLRDLEQGYLRRQLAMPLSRFAIVLAPILTGALMVVLQAAVIVALGLVLGASFASGVGGLAVLLAIALLWGTGIAGYSVASGLLARNAQAIQAMLLIFFPILFLAPTLLPKDQLRGWVDAVATVNPTTYVLDGMRALLISGWDGGKIVGALVAAGGFGLLMMAWAGAMARRATAQG
jgi:ABC-2 type transport system permease protein